MSNPPDSPDGRLDGGEQGPPDDAARFAAAWDQIVAELSSGPDAIGDGGGPAAAEDGAGPGSNGGPGYAAKDPQGAPDQLGAAGPQGASDRPGSPDGLARLFEPLRRAQEPSRPATNHPAGSSQEAADLGPAAQGPTEPEPSAWNPKDWHDEGHFVPPPPPDIPEGTPLSRLAWVGTLGGPAILLGSALTGIDLPQMVSIAAGIAALAGFATLVWLLPDSRGEDSGWDDGARL